VGCALLLINAVSVQCFWFTITIIVVDTQELAPEGGGEMKRSATLPRDKEGNLAVSCVAKPPATSQFSAVFAPPHNDNVLLASAELSISQRGAGAWYTHNIFAASLTLNYPF
jgi:hypothetical protein